MDSLYLSDDFSRSDFFSLSLSLPIDDNPKYRHFLSGFSISVFDYSDMGVAPLRPFKDGCREWPTFLGSDQDVDRLSFEERSKMWMSTLILSS